MVDIKSFQTFDNSNDPTIPSKLSEAELNLSPPFSTAHSSLSSHSGHDSVTFQRVKNLHKELFQVEYSETDELLYPLDSRELLYQVSEEEFQRIEAEAKHEGVIFHTWEEKMTLSKVRKSASNQQKVQALMQKYIKHYTDLEQQIEEKYPKQAKSQLEKFEAKGDVIEKTLPQVEEKKKESKIEPLLDSIDKESVFQCETRYSNFVSFTLRNALPSSEELKRITEIEMEFYYTKYKCLYPYFLRYLGNSSNVDSEDIEGEELELGPWISNSEKARGQEAKNISYLKNGKRNPNISYKSEVEKVHEVPDEFFSIE